MSRIDSQRDWSAKVIDKFKVNVKPSDLTKSSVQRTFEFVVYYKRHQRRGGISRHAAPPPAYEEETFIIEQKELGIHIEKPTVVEAKKELDDLLQAIDLDEGGWSLWMHVQTRGGKQSRWGGSDRDCVAHCEMELSFYAHHDAGNGHIRSMAYPRAVPRPFTGEWEHPTETSELHKLSNGLPSAAREKDWQGRTRNDSIYMEATPENVEAVRWMIQRLSGFNEELARLLNRENFDTTLAAIKAGGGLPLLGDGGA